MCFFCSWQKNNKFGQLVILVQSLFFLASFLDKIFICHQDSIELKKHGAIKKESAQGPSLGHESDIKFTIEIALFNQGFCIVIDDSSNTINDAIFQK